MPTFSGKNVKNAINIGLNRLRLTRDQVKVDVIQKGRKGFLGIGRRDAEVKLTRIIPKKQVEPKRRPQPNRQKASAVHNYTADKHYDIKIKPTKVKQPKLSKSHLAIDKLEKYLDQIITLLGINVTMKVDFQASRRVKINLKTDKEGLLIGKHGLTINALQSLSEIYLDRLGFYHFYVELDTADYRQRRMEILGRLAKKTARDAVATGKPVYLDPMPSFERKKIHKTLEDSAHVTTYSAGREPYRAVVVAPK